MKTFTVTGFGTVKSKVKQIYEEKFYDEECLRRALDSRFAEFLQVGVYLYIDVHEHFYPFRKRRIYGLRKAKT